MPSTPYQTTSTPPATMRGMYQFVLGTIDLSTITAADLVTTYTMPHDFKVVDVRCIVNTAASTAAKAATITARITPAGGTIASVTGAALAITTANMTPAGKVNIASATDVLSGGNNQGKAGDTISVTASSVTAFSEGRATFIVTIQDIDCA